MKTVITVFTVMLLIVSCGDKSDKQLAMLKNKLVETQDREPYRQGNITDTMVIPIVDDKKQPGPSPPVQYQDWDKKIIKIASIDAEVRDYKQFSSSLRDKVKSVGGYIAQEEQKQSRYKIENTITIKVPVDQFDNLVVQLESGVEKLNERSVTSHDVTTEIVDTRSRLEAKRQTRLRYLDLLKQARNMEEILNVQREVNSIQEEIESAAGRMEYLSHSSSFSTVNLSYYQILNQSAKNDDNPSFGTKAGNAFKTGWSWVGELAIGLVSIWPLLIIVLFIVLRYRRWRTQKVKV